MPTTYTDSLYRGEVSFRDFALCCLRGIDHLHLMRGLPLGTPIPEKFTPAPNHLMEGRRILARLTELMTVADKTWITGMARADYKKRRDDYLTALDRSIALRGRYLAMRQQVCNWQPTPEGEGLREFMLAQLDQSIEDDCDGNVEPSRLTTDEWHEREMAKARRDLVYHFAEHAKASNRAAKSTAYVQAILASLPAQKSPN